ncbi:MAG: hypothetical protein ACYCXU_05295 [Thermoleophilia bacterium]
MTKLLGGAAGARALIPLAAPGGATAGAAGSSVTTAATVASGARCVRAAR